jgi:hypothetical protein
LRILEIRSDAPPESGSAAHESPSGNPHPCACEGQAAVNAVAACALRAALRIPASSDFRTLLFVSVRAAIAW